MYKLVLPALELAFGLEDELVPVVELPEPLPELPVLPVPPVLPVLPPPELPELPEPLPVVFVDLTTAGQVRLKVGVVDRLWVMANLALLSGLESRRLYQKVGTLLKRRPHPMSSQ